MAFIWGVELTRWLLGETAFISTEGVEGETDFELLGLGIGGDFAVVAGDIGANSGAGIVAEGDTIVEGDCRGLGEALSDLGFGVGGKSNLLTTLANLLAVGETEADGLLVGSGLIAFSIGFPALEGRAAFGETPAS